VVTLRKNASTGFSLVELLTVMAVGAILAATAIPYGLNYIRHYQVTAAGQAVASVMQLSRAQAVKRNSRNGLILNFDYPAEGQFQFTSGTHCCSAPTDRSRRSMRRARETR